MPSPATDAGVTRQLVAIIEDLTEDWDTGLAGRIGPDTTLVDDLGFASVDVVALVVAIDEHWQRRDWPYERLLMTGGHYVDDLRVGDISAFLHEHGAG